MPYKDPEARKAYNKAYQKKHYAENKEYYKEKALRSNKKIRGWNRDFVNRVKAKLGCFDCGESNPIVLEFDHVTGNKADNIADMVNKSYSTETIKQEIRKCKVRCANCHRIKTHERRNK